MLGFFQDQVLSAARPEGQEGGLGKDVTLRRAVDAAEPKIAHGVPRPADHRGVGTIGPGRHLPLPRRTGPRGPAARAGPGTSNGRASAPTTPTPSPPEQPRPGLLGRRPARPGDPAAGADARGPVGPARRRPPRHAHHPEQPRLAYRAAGLVDRAIPLLERTLAAPTSKLGADHPDTLTSPEQPRHGLPGRRPVGPGDPAVRADAGGPDGQARPRPPDTLTSRNNLAEPTATPARMTGRSRCSSGRWRRDGQARRRPPGYPHHPEQPGLGLLDAGRSDRAIPLLERTLAAQAAKLGADHPDTLPTQQNLAMAYRDAGRKDLAIPMLERTLAAQTAKLGADHPSGRSSPRTTSPAYRDVGQLDRAVALLERTLAAQAAKLGADHPTRSPPRTTSPWPTGTPAGWTGRSRCSSGRWRPGRPSSAPTTPGPSPRGTILRRPTRRGAIPTRAESMLRDVLAARRRRWAPSTPTSPRPSPPWAEPPGGSGGGPRPSRCFGRAWRSGTRDAPTTGPGSRPGACSATACSGQEKYAEAEPLLLSGYEGMKARESRIPASKKVRLTEAGERIVRLYEAWGKPEEAETWRARLATPLPWSSLAARNPGPPSVYKESVHYCESGIWESAIPWLQVPHDASGGGGQP